MTYHKVQFDLDGRTLSLETGKLAKEANGSVVVRLGDTMVLATATMAGSQRAGIDFFPLLIDFEEKLYAVGRIPGSYFRREGRPTEKAILTSRLIDRPIRPLFADGFRNDVQIVVTPLSVDMDNPPDILAMIGASAALSISDIPFQGPAGAARVGRIDGKFVINPSTDQSEKSDLEVVVAGTKDAVMMVEASGKEVSEANILEAIEVALVYIKKVIALQEELVSKIHPVKANPPLYAPNTEMDTFIRDGWTKKLEEALQITDKIKQENALDHISIEINEKIKASDNTILKGVQEKKPTDIKEIVKSIQKKIVRKMISEKKVRPDGRKLDEVRPISCETGLLPRAHGCGLFTRGETQVLTVATLGSVGDEQIIEGLSPDEYKKHYLHHYNFPAYSVGEVRPLRGPGRRDIGHGALAEKAILPVLPPEDKFPYTIRLVSEVLGSNGSTSMAATCGSTLALMDAGVPISAPVSGVAMGLIKEGNEVNILTDIQGLEDFLGDMDFKVTGTRKGVTAIQMDIKIKGISIDIMRKALEAAKIGRLFILEKMEAAIAKPRPDLSPFAPRITTINIPVELIGKVIGPGGKNIRAIIEETGAQIDIEDDGRVFITSTDAEAAKKAQKWIESMTYQPKVGDVFDGIVTRIMNFGCFVELVPGVEGLCHISQLSAQRVNRVEDVVKVGDSLKVKLTEIDDQGRLNLSHKAVMQDK